jgi:radical SAM/Cys-rich protein
MKESQSSQNDFCRKLVEHDRELTRATTSVLQVNIGLKCNQVCRHCHVEAGPGRQELMTGKTMDQVVAYAKRGGFKLVDITGGAPELNPDLQYFLEKISAVVPAIMLRCNLTAFDELADQGHQLLQLCIEKKVVIVSSFPSTNIGQTDNQRGKGVWRKSIDKLLQLNELGYGKAGSGLVLNLVSNPSGAFLPVSQCQAELKFKKDLAGKWGIEFNQLFTFANMPLGRFKKWLLDSGNYEQYMKKLVDAFNPTTIDGLMCRSLVSVSWDGYLYDCDFNLACNLPLSGKKVHVSETGEPPAPGSSIATEEHCFACTAGSGFT